MATVLEVAPFPALKWDGWHWRGACALPWFPSRRKINLLVCTNSSRSAERTKPSVAPLPTAEQAGAFHVLLHPEAPTAAALLAIFQDKLPELRSADWGSVRELLELADVIVFAATWEGLAYTGFVFNSAEYEHGIGVVAHGSRVVHIGNAEEADESAAEKDVRRLKRAKRSDR